MNSSLPPHIIEGISDFDLDLAGLRYDGFQEGCNLVPGSHLYTRLEDPKASFAIHAGETVAEAHRRVLIAFLEAAAA